ncbi:MAG: AAA family ATPase, partial [Proteobacteria bacterium]|nr:AAA family ATPase [Pseudomonadota bacterium]
MDSDVSDKVIILHHLDLMALGSDSLLDQMARNMTYLLHLNPLAVFVAFKDPEIPLPESLVRFFSMSTSIFGIERRHLYKIITAEEAKRFGETRIDIYDLYKRFSGLNALQIRQLLERIVGMKIPHFPMGEEEVRQELRRRTLSASYMELPDITFDDIGGCGEIIEKLEQDILRFVDMLKNPGESDDDDSMDAIRNIEKRIPRYILFEGPPGTGKTLLAKALANRLNAAVIVVNGPEIIGKWLGESEGKLREVFSKARKSAPSVIIFDEIDSIGGRRSEGEDAGGAGSAMNRLVNQLLTEMDGFRNEELVFVIGTTNHSSLLDPALMSRVQKIFHIPYPNDKGRREIFQIFNNKLDLKLSEEKLKFLVGKTEAWINPNNWRKFGGREIGALCSAIDRKTYDAERRDISLHELNDLVEEQIEVHFPKIRFQDIGGYQEVKRQLQEDILSMMKLAQEFGDNPSKLKVVEEAIPRGVIFEGPSGTGKTMFAMALANALDASIIVINASELKSSLYGDSEKKVHTLFEEARRNSPAVIVFDEMDALMGNRQGQDSSPAGGGSVDSSLVNQLLTEMDGLKTKDMVFVIGTTNLASVLDPAFKRPSRFSRIVHIPYPSEDDRRAILEIYNDKYKLGFTDKVYEVILEETENWIDADKYIRFSGDHLRYICQAVQRTRLKEGTKKSEKGDLKYIRRFIKGMIKVPFEPVDLDKDIGGYDDVKSALHEDILDMLLLARSRKDNPDQFFQIKNSIPKGVVFYGPPGTGKTLFARALATALKASIRVVNGPELKSAWQGETERM